MRIGFLSGDVVEVDDKRKGVGVPDYLVQGHLLRRLQDRGHEIVLLSRVPMGTHVTSIPFDWDQPGVHEVDPKEYDLDVLLCDRIGRHAAYYNEALWVLERYHGPVVYHQYVGYPGWAPPFRDTPQLLDVKREWTIVNRANDPYRGYMAMAGWREHVRKESVRWERWEPFLMLEHPFGDKLSPMSGRYLTLHGGRPYHQGYHGRLPKREKRSQLVAKYLGAIPDWSKVVYGPPTSTKWVSEATGADDMGRAQYSEIPAALESYRVTVQVPHDRFAGKGTLDIWPNRIGECAIAGVLQLFDRGYGLRELREWEVENPTHFAALGADGWDLKDEVERQRRIILPRCDPERVLDSLERILYDATGLTKEEAA